jgi:hypothetical protein
MGLPVLLHPLVWISTDCPEALAESSVAYIEVANGFVLSIIICGSNCQHRRRYYVDGRSDSL